MQSVNFARSAMMNDSFLRWPQVSAITGLSRTTIWRLERAGKFPSRRKISPGAVAWLNSEVITWRETRATAGGQS